MKAPQLTRRLILEEPVRTPDGAGGFTHTWRSLGTVWAQMDARTGGERGFGEATVSAARYKVVLRAAPFESSMRPKPEQRLRDAERIFSVLAVVDAFPDARFLTCYVSEEVSA